jgi:hemoglobin
MLLLDRIASFHFEWRLFPVVGIDYNPDMSDSEVSLYELLGGETGLRSLVDRFYDLMDSSPEAEKIRVFHAKSLKQSREKLFMFLSGWSGGPQLYMERFGHPRLRMRHMPFPIGEAERDQWLWCMNKALEESQLEPRVEGYLKGRFAEVADFMRNT